MEEQATGQEGQVESQGVTEASQTSEGQETSESQQTEGTQEAKEEEGRIPMSRWNQKLKAERELRAEVQKYKQDFQRYQKAIQFHEAVSQDPKKLEAIMRALNSQEEPQKDPYAEYDPDVAERFRKLDELEKWKAQLETRERAREAKSITGHKQSLEDEFEGYLKSDGLIDKDGSYDEDKINVVSKATLAMMAEIAEDPNLPTKAELKKAYDLVTKGLSSWSKSTLTKVVKQNVPGSGSKSGVPVSGGGKMTSAQRIAQIASEL